MVEVIDRRAARFADVSARHFGYDLRNAHGAGAAGGLGYAFMEYFQATMCSGAELLLGACHFDEMIDETAVIVTGEGSSDAQTLMGKLPFVVMAHGRRKGVDVVLWSGRVQDAQRLLDAGFASVGSIHPEDFPQEEAMRPDVAEAHLAQRGAQLVRELRLQGKIK